MEPVPVQAKPQPFPSISELLKRQGIWLEKRKSQHFLRNQRVCSEIAALAQLDRDDLAVEVGAGLANLSVELAARAGRVLSIELDQSFTEWHQYLQTLYPNLEFLYNDFLKVDLAAETLTRKPAGGLIGVGNLPYQITSDILFEFINSPLRFERLVFMIQKEVADRISAGPASRESGALTYKIALGFNARIAMLVGPQEFLPPPKVWSAVLVLEPLNAPHYGSQEERSHIYTLVDRIFQYRRKTVLNGLLMGGLVSSRDHAESTLSRAGVDPKQRPESLTLDQLVSLSRALRASP
jgi:16S rRNA (adenine1518-N6/adenine1519-N6)-dimethyltransferase